jgi:pilus assembly protein CpaF
MSLLDRVQQRRTGDEAAPFGLQQRTVAPAAPAPAAPSTPESAPAATAVVDAPGQNGNRSASPLLNRTGFGQRASLGKSNALQERYDTLRGRVHQRLVEEMVGVDNASHDTVVAKIGELVTEVAIEMAMTISRQDKQRLVDHLVNDTLGLGPLEQLLADPEVTEVMINGHKHIYVEQRGRITRSPVSFESNDQLMQVIDRIVSSIGRRVDESSPMVDARLKDGSRVNVIIPPLALTGPTVTIRKFAKDPLQISDLLRFGSVTQPMVDFMRACVRSRMNVVVSGGTGSGKTTTLNILSSFIPDDERIVTIEDAAELQLRQDHVVTLETRPANVEGRGRVAIRDLVINSLRMRPDRIVVGECRGGEALDMLQAMNTGHDGSLTTVHANTPNDALSRLETMVLMAGAELPSRAIREQIGSAINIIVQQSRLRDGTRKIVSVAEVLGYDGERVQLQDIFAFKQTGVDGDGHVTGQLTPTGVIPQCLEHLASEGEALDISIFTPQDLAVAGGDG